MKRIALLVAILAAVFAAGARADAGGTIYVECFDADGIDWYVPVELVEQSDPTACNPLIAEGPLPAPPPTDEEAPPPDTGGTDVGFDSDPNIAPDPSLYSTEVRCPDGSVWAIAIGDPFICPAPALE
jgi:hypothetical protein